MVTDGQRGLPFPPSKELMNKINLHGGQLNSLERIDANGRATDIKRRLVLQRGNGMVTESPLTSARASANVQPYLLGESFWAYISDVQPLDLASGATAAQIRARAPASFLASARARYGAGPTDCICAPKTGAPVVFNSNPDPATHLSAAQLTLARARDLCLPASELLAAAFAVPKSDQSVANSDFGGFIRGDTLRTLTVSREATSGRLVFSWTKPPEGRTAAFKCTTTDLAAANKPQQTRVLLSNGDAYRPTPANAQIAPGEELTIRSQGATCVDFWAANPRLRAEGGRTCGKVKLVFAEQDRCFCFALTKQPWAPAAAGAPAAPADSVEVMRVRLPQEQIAFASRVQQIANGRNHDEDA